MGASIPHRPGRTLTVTHAHGMACWDLEARGAEGCSGPVGKSAAGPGFLDAGSAAGALIVKTRDGRTWFSVNGRSGDFRGNEGFYEFDVEVK